MIFRVAIRRFIIKTLNGLCIFKRFCIKYVAVVYPVVQGAGLFAEVGCLLFVPAGEVYIINKDVNVLVFINDVILYIMNFKPMSTRLIDYHKDIEGLVTYGLQHVFIHGRVCH